jgi:hypothetical protein
MDAQTVATPIDEIRPHPDNPKGHDLDTLVESIRRFGFAEPIVVDQRTGLNISGHGRVEALTELRMLVAAGATDANGTPYAVPTGITVDDDDRWLAPVFVGWRSRDDAEAAAALIALNRTTETGGWLNEPLADLLDRLAEIDDGFAGVGFDDKDLADLRARLAGPPDLDELAAGYDPDGDPTANHVKVVLVVPPDVADRWSLHASEYADDGTALLAALGVEVDA